ncbi:AraC family transcriptional regulator [Clostridium botulinum]|uniref:AraC family transcriptional regulator n=1 Tax=Clostridium botulinum TaxID=1491 RepID=A0AAU8Z0I5_CLOBO|nr:AraC family transcriptional regulator [Clostridium sporogenes]AVP65361.1 AraC family transcriptional regulator [Clostridium botulinum]MCF4015937.1 AraC family transcriptional regulator [Clostridium sporogenes]NFM16254.1 AraC family transcriptional regulator [Clostridium sporogenes]
MEWIEQLNRAINYMEEHLEEGIEIKKVAEIACCSTFHFQRMFSYIANIPLAEYIRRRKMTRAAFDLQNKDIKIIDIAMKYGYDSSTAFTRAFKNIHGISPSEAKSSGMKLKAFPPISFKISIKGDVEMNYRIEKKEDFRVVGVKKHYKINIEENFAEVPIFWKSTTESGMISEISSLMCKEPFGLLGISACMNGEDFDYYIAVATDKEVPNGMYEYIVPECTWAIFESIGPLPEALQNLQKRIVTEWLPTSGYEYANVPDIEVYPEGNPQSEDYKCEAWLPIIKKTGESRSCSCWNK